MEKSTARKNKLNIVHYNDVYELRGVDAELAGGADRFCAKVNELRDLHDAIVLFSGDLWNPSKLAMAKKGTQMVRIVNEVQTKAACVGNHDLVQTADLGFGGRTGEVSGKSVSVPLAAFQRAPRRRLAHRRIARLHHHRTRWPTSKTPRKSRTASAAGCVKKP